MSTRAAWRWRRRIPAAQLDDWLARTEPHAGANWAVTQRPGSDFLTLAVYLSRRAAAAKLVARWRGRIDFVEPKSWLSVGRRKPLRMGAKLAVYPGPVPARKISSTNHLIIPHGLAFGSGEHATTTMLLRALVQRAFTPHDRVLDLGTGSGILALAARKLGAVKIRATDFDPDAVRTARQNEELNFSKRSIQWRRSDVLRPSEAGPFDLVLANLFSGLLCAASENIAGCLAPGGELWLSGILVAQRREVAAAYRKSGLRALGTIRRGNWLMVQWRKPRAVRPRSPD